MLPSVVSFLITFGNEQSAIICDSQTLPSYRLTGTTLIYVPALAPLFDLKMIVFDCLCPLQDPGQNLHVICGPEIFAE